ncbi:oligogalacturonate lyase family protein [Paenibacillus kandeliae]|uniref:oligogalacturonate lyase family protein n=1 Tax=Paenibacillus kandeliae TaxID=3231269 RepID=UPI00345A3E2D
MSRTIAMVKGTIWAPEWSTYTDRRTGLKVHQLTDYRGHSRLPYFTEQPLYDNGKRLLFISDRDNSANLFSMQLETGEMTQLTTYANNDDLDVALTPDEQYALVSDKQVIRALHLTHFRERIKYRCPEGYVLGNITCTADSRTLLTCITEDLSQRIDTDLGNGYVGHREWMDAQPNSIIIAVDLKSGQSREVFHTRHFVTHINASPTLPWLLTFCHEGPWHLVDHRIWGLDLRNGEVWSIRQRREDGEAVGHECFLPDGEQIGYHGISTDGTCFFGRIRYDNTRLEEQEIPFSTWHLYQNEALAVADGQGAVDTLHLWQRDTNGSYDGAYEVCELRCSFHSQKLHAHPRLSEDGRRLFFNSDRHGYGNLYMVELPEELGQLPRFKRSEHDGV